MHPLLIHVVFESHNLSGQKTTATPIYCTNLFVLCDIFIVVGRSTNWPHPTLWPCVHPDPIGSLPWNTTWRAYKLTGLWRKGHSLRFQDMSTSHLYSVGDLHGDDQSYQTILKALGLLSNDGTLDAVDQNPGLVPVLHGGWVVQIVKPTQLENDFLVSHHFSTWNVTSRVRFRSFHWQKSCPKPRFTCFFLVTRCDCIDGLD